MKKKLKSDSPLRAATCSPSSLTPETDAAEFGKYGIPSEYEGLLVTSDFARTLEVDLSEARKDLLDLKREMEWCLDWAPDASQAKAKRIMAKHFPENAEL